MSLLVVEMFAEEGDILVELVTGTEEDRIRIDFGHATVNVSVPEGTALTEGLLRCLAHNVTGDPS